MLTQQILKNILDYNPESGVFSWKSPQAHRLKVGDEAGWQEPSRYRRINIKGKLFYAHRLAFLYMTGSLPTHDIDHINGDKHDNRWENLRAATRSQNLMNKSYKNKTGFKGVAYSKDRNKYRAYIIVNNKIKWLGQFSSPELAHQARENFARQYQGEFYHP